MAVILECSDPWDRVIELDEEVWRLKIVKGGLRLPEDALDSMRVTLVEPDLVTFDKFHRDGECFYRSSVLPGPLSHLYLKVCVKIVERPVDERASGRVVTAYPTDRVPRGEQRKWP